MAELIGVAASSSVASGFKQELMLFDRIALPCAADVLRSSTDSALTDAAMTADLEWLLESGLVFDPYEKGHESLALPDAVSDMRALFEQKLLDRSAAHIMGGAPLVTARTSCTGRRLRPE